MKAKILALALALACSSPLQAQIAANDSVSLGPGYANDVWYSLQDGAVKTEPANNWDLAFQIEAREAGIRINEVKGIALYLASDSFEDFETADTAGKITEENRLHNSDTSWNYGAFNALRNAQNPFDYGWGLYDQPSNTVNGTRVFFLKLNDTTWRKVRIHSLTENASLFTIESATLDNGTRDTLTFDRRDYAGKRFGYWAHATGELDREPAADAWDLLFTRYFAPVQGTHYPVMGVLANYNRTFFGGAGVLVAQADDVDTATVKTDEGQTYSSNINVIGSDWKEFVMASNEWEIADRRVYFVSDMEERVWRLIFTGFGGSANGTSYFFRELVPTSRKNAASFAAFNVWPNPTADALRFRAEGNALNGAATAQLFSVDGRLLQSLTLHADGASVEGEMSLQDLPAGLYLLNVQADGHAPAWSRVIKSN